MLESYYKLPPKPKLVPEFKDAFQLIWPALPKKIIELWKTTASDCRSAVDILNV